MQLGQDSFFWLQLEKIVEETVEWFKEIYNLYIPMTKSFPQVQQCIGNMQFHLFSDEVLKYLR